MATELFAADRATTTVSSGGTTAPAGGTAETWTVASSAMFGAASTGVSQFHVADPAAPSEIIAVTNVSGTTWTVTRGSESTAPVTHQAGFTVYQVVTAGWLSTLGTGGGSGTVTSVTATDTSIVVSGTTTVAPTIATGTLDVIATQHPPAGNWSNNSRKITSLANGSAAQDAAAFGQIPAALPPNGSASGDLGGTYPSPTVMATHLASALPVAQGGTGQASQAAAMTALAGAQSAGKYLRSDGVNTALAVIQAGDVPTLNQNTSGTAAGLSATLAIGSGGTGQTSAANALNALGGAAVAGDIGGTSASPQVTATHLASALPVNQGGTGSTTRNFAGLLTPTAVKTTTYTAAAGDFVPCDTTSGSFTVTLPNAPADLTVVGVKQVTQGGTNTVTIACAGSDVFNKAGGATTGSLAILAQGMLLQYKASGGIWYVVADDLPLTQLDARYLALSGGTLTGSLTVGGALSTTPVTLTDAATITVNAAASDFFRVTLGGNRTLGAPSSPADGQAIVIEVIQDGTGSRTLAYNAVYSFPSSIGTPVLSATAAFHDFLAFRYDSAATTWYCVGFVPQSTAVVPATVAQGGTGDSSLTAYGVLTGGTTSTGAVQSVSPGSSGNILTSQGGSALPSFQALDSTATDIAQTGTAATAGSTGKVPDAGHIHANSLVIPADFSFQAWTFDPGSCNATNTAGTSLMYLVRFFVRQSTVLTNVIIHVATSSATLNSGQNYLAVYDSGGTCRAVTADQTAAWGSTGVKTTAFGGAYTAAAGWYYFVANVSVASATGIAARASVGTASAFIANAGLSAQTLRIATQAAAVAIPTAGSSTLTLSSNVQTSAAGLCAVFT